MFVIKGVVGSLFQTAIIGALILLPAWTWQWTEANQFLICYGILSIVSTVFLALKAPASLEARLELPMNETQPLSDRIATRFLLMFLMGWFVFIPIDVFYLKLLAPPQQMIQILGGILSLFGYVIMLLALYQNEFATPVVRDQSERGHELRDAGFVWSGTTPFLYWFYIILYRYGAVAAKLCNTDCRLATLNCIDWTDLR